MLVILDSISLDSNLDINPFFLQKLVPVLKLWRMWKQNNGL